MITNLAPLVEKCERLGNECLLALDSHRNLLAAIKGFRNGLMYGMRIRAPHALVTVVLFGEGTATEKIRTILQLTLIHATNLAKFAFSYKLLHGFLRRIEGKTYEWHSFISAFIVGYMVFGDNNGVNMQVRRHQFLNLRNIKRNMKVSLLKSPTDLPHMRDLEPVCREATSR
uniref:Peroxisomal membrane protein 4 n=1 Tax=Angiostrongylus cantonensis TaxID=6313 RepID=A0A0K0DRL7_ANGCA